MKDGILTDEAALRLAIAEARKGAAGVSPNPLVGCAILDSHGHLLAVGHHEKYGGPHAEVNAVRQLPEEKLRGAQVFVTLEPCAHEGKTPACAKMLARLPIARVVFGLVDPNPLVSGQGAAILREAGIRCDLYRDLHGDGLDADLEEVCEAFLWNQRQKKVFVSLKIAASLDGRIALADGSSRWITGPESRERVHELRAAHDAVLIGSGTLEKDDPSLDVRHPRVQKANKVVVLDSEGRFLGKPWKLFSTHAPTDVFWMVGKGINTPHTDTAGVRVLSVERGKTGGLEPESVLGVLWSEGVRSVMIEGGARVAGSFLRASAVNRLHLFQAPVILGDQGLSWTSGFPVEAMAAKPVLRAARTQVFGRDTHLTGLFLDPRSGVKYRDA